MVAGFTRSRTAALFCGLSVAAAVFSAGSPSPAADPTPQELAARLRETLTGLHTIEMEYRQTQTFNGRTTTNECEWLRSGDKLRLIYHAGELPGGWWSFDGQYGHSVNYFPDRETEIRGISKTLTPPTGLDFYSPADWLGLRLYGLPSVDLADLLAQPQARIVATETFGAVPAYRVDLGEHQTEVHGTWTWTAVICPGRDSLPVDISCEPADGNPDSERLGNAIGSVRFLVLDFYEVHDAALQRTRWLPQRMRRETKLAVHELEASVSRVNHEVSKTAFVPRPQPGTELIDNTVPGDRKVRVYKPEAALTQQAADLAKEVRPPTTPAEAAVARAPDASLWTTIALWSGAFCLLSAAVVYFLYSRQVS